MEISLFVFDRTERKLDRMTGYVDPLIGMTISFAAVPTMERERDEAPRGGLGSQVLPVAELDDDFDASPEDGLEYLFLVRSVPRTLSVRTKTD